MLNVEGKDLELITEYIKAGNISAKICSINKCVLNDYNEVYFGISKPDLGYIVILKDTRSTIPFFISIDIGDFNIDYLKESCTPISITDMIELLASVGLGEITYRGTPVRRLESGLMAKDIAYMSKVSMMDTLIVNEDDYDCRLILENANYRFMIYVFSIQGLYSYLRIDDCLGMLNMINTRKLEKEENKKEDLVFGDILEEFNKANKKEEVKSKPKLEATYKNDNADDIFNTDIFSSSNEIPTNTTIKRAIKKLSKSDLDSCSRIEIVVLVKDNIAVGFRFLIDNIPKYDMDINTAKELGITTMKVSKKLEVKNVNGFYLSSSEIKNRRVIEDISENRELCKKLIDKFYNIIWGSN